MLLQFIFCCASSTGLRLLGGRTYARAVLPIPETVTNRFHGPHHVRKLMLSSSGMMVVYYAEAIVGVRNRAVAADGNTPPQPTPYKTSRNLVSSSSDLTASRRRLDVSCQHYSLNLGHFCECIETLSIRPVVDVSKKKRNP